MQYILIYYILLSFIPTLVYALQLSARPFSFYQLSLFLPLSSQIIFCNCDDLVNGNHRCKNVFACFIPKLEALKRLMSDITPTQYHLMSYRHRGSQLGMSTALWVSLED